MLIKSFSSRLQYKRNWQPGGDALILQMDPSLNLRRNLFAVPNDKMEAIFAPTVRAILDLLKGQMRLAGPGVVAVFLLGGFGESTYLRSRVIQCVGGAVLVLQPEDSWTPVVRGATMLGVGRVVSSAAGVTIVPSRLARPAAAETPTL